jgi:hypothetical protein
MIPNVSLGGATPDAATVDRDNPWPGLEAYREADKEFFHGRREESDELLRSVLRAQLTVFFGKSGLGKTSLLKAGLFPHLREQPIIPIYIRLAFPADQPSLNAQVKDAIYKAAAAMSIEAPPTKEKETLWEYFHHQEADFWNKRNQIMLPVLVFDQFEEIFTRGRTDEDKEKASESFLVELGDLIEGRPPITVKEHLDASPEEAGRFAFSRHHYRIVLSLREDFLPELEGLKERIPSLHYNRLRLLPMNGEAAQHVVAHAQDLIASDVAQKVVRFVAAEDNPDKPLEDLVIEPALLSVVCRELNNKRKKKGEPRIGADLLEGSQKEILDDFYERSMADLTSEIRTFVEERLLTASGYRDSVALDNALRSPGVTQEVINKLENRRLIRKEERDGRVRLELTHDLLTRVIAASRDRRRQVEKEIELKQEVAERERQQRLEERAKSARRLRLLSAGLAIFFLTAIATSIIALHRGNELAGLLTKQKELLRNESTERKRAESAEKIIEEQYKRIKAGIKVRQAIISNDIKKIKESIETIPMDQNITFKVTEKSLNYKDGKGREIYQYKIFPNESSIHGGLSSIALITYIMDHPTFKNQLNSVVTDKKFSYEYKGWGFLSDVIAIIEYSDEDKSLTVAKINMGEILEDVSSQHQPATNIDKVKNPFE